MRNLIIIFFTFVSFAATAQHTKTEIPPALQEWQAWVLEKHPEIRCPFLYNAAQRNCVWPSELKIDATAQGATFSQRIDVYQDAWVALPGTSGFWPENVRDLSGNLSTAQITVRGNQNSPEIFLPIGNYEIAGNIRWEQMPRTLSIPAEAGIVQLRLNGTSLPSPTIEAGNQLRLASTPAQSSSPHQDSLQVRVFRHLTDDIPFKISTQILLDVSGKEREVQLEQVLLDNFQLIEFFSELPARIENNGSLRVQLKAGSWELTINSITNQSVETLGYHALNDLWPQQEIWVFDAQPEIRSVQISGAPTIDPTQTQLPEDWHDLPAYLLTPDTSLQLDTLHRGVSDNSNNKLQLRKDMWLDFDGTGFTLRDTITGQLNQGWRLEALLPYELQSAELGGEPQLVTRLQEGANAGIEIRDKQVNLTGISRLVRSTSVPISGWTTDFDAVSTTLHLAPGWSLITATGASSETGSWVSRWSLWDIFLVLIISFTIGRITQPLWGALAFITLILTYHRSDAPLFIWLNIAAALALMPLVSGKFKHFLTRYNYAGFLVLALLLLPFSVQQAREAFYPQQEFAHKNIGDNYGYTDNSYSENYDAQPAAPMMSKSAEYANDSAEEVVVTSFHRSKKFSNQTQELSKAYDPGQQVQAGTSVPQWSWNSAHLEWNGLVKPDEITRLYIASPWMNRIGNVLSVVLPLLLGLLLLQHFLRQTGISLAQVKLFKPNAALPLVLIAALGISPSEQAQADVLISNALLKELETRLTKTPECLPNCANIESLTLTANGDQLSIQTFIHSAGFIALPLPAQPQEWSPSQVSVDGKAALLVKNANGQLLVNLNAGRHQLNLMTALQGRDSINLNFPLLLHNVTTQLQGWQITGLPTATQTSSSLQLQRSERSESASKAEHLRPEPIAPFVIVSRTLKLGIEWTLETEVVRIAPESDAIHLQIPLLTGETPLNSKDIVITGDETSQGKIAISIAADEDSISWSSSLKTQSPFKLQAPENVPWVEVWSIDAAPIWHMETEGIAAIESSDEGNLPVWQPWPGESISINITRPEAIKSNLLAIDNVHLNHTLGQRAHSSELTMKVRTHQAAHYDFALPEKVNFTGITIDGQEQSLNPNKGILKIPLHPGEQNIAIRWQSAEGINLHALTPAIALGNASSNQAITINLPNDRWPLLVGGPRIGPSVLLWGMLAVILLLAVGLGRSNLTPLKTHHWVLLSVGIATVNLYIVALIALWLILLAKRGTMTSLPSPLAFKWMQVGLFGLSLFALGALLSSIPFGLLSSPDMHITGNGSSAYYLRWYQDHSDSQFPQAWVISLPMWSYKLVMLLWSLWLAAALLQWIRWGWQQISQTALWYLPEAEKKTE